MSDFIMVLITAPNEEDASRMAKAIVSERLAACVNIIRNIRSIYRWQGNIEDESEVLMLVKTRTELFDALSLRVKELHSYTVPEIISIEIENGSADYFAWLKEMTSSKT